jgi:hypothetical protein
MGDTSLVKSGPLKLVTILVGLLFITTSLIIVTFSGDVQAKAFSDAIIDSDISWTLSDSPVDVEGNITISENGSLTIHPGVLVNFPEGSFLQVNGSLEIRGTEAAPVTIQGSGSEEFDRINVTSGGTANITHCSMDTGRGVNAAGGGTEVRILNSTITSDLYGFTSGNGAESWLINCTFNSISNVSVSGGTVHEGNWFRFKAMKDNGEGPYADGADLTMFASNPNGRSYMIYDSTSGDPRTDTDGEIPPIAVEQYLHEGSTSQNRVKITITMSAENARWRKQENEWEIRADTDYTWFMDFTPPQPPVNFTVVDKGGEWILISWDFEGDESRLAYFIIEYKKHWEAESEWDRVEPSPSAREWNISVENPPNPNQGLLEEMEYNIKMYCLDGSDNPSTIVGPITVKTLDMTKPLPPVDLEILDVGGSHALLGWNRSSSSDVIEYGIMIHGGVHDDELIRVPADGNVTQQFNITNLESETDYSISLAAFDDGEVQRNSTWTEEIEFRTLDVTSPAKPTLALEFLDPYQYINGSGYYNGSQIALQGFVMGENRTFIDVYINDLLYVHPNPDLPRPSSYQGDFFFFITLEHGEYNIKVRSVDPSGNEGPFSDTVNIEIDLMDPFIGVEIPDGGIHYVDSGILAEIDSNCTDDNSIHNVNWILEGPDGSTLEETGGVLSEVFSEGEWNITLEAVDIAGNRNRTEFKVVSRIPDSLIPEATLITPASATDVDHAPIFKVEFSEMVVWDALSAMVQIKDEVGTQPIDVLMEIDHENLTATFELTDSLEGGTNYSFILAVIRDLRGNRGEDLEFDFRTIDDDRVDSDGDGIPDFYEVQKTFLSPSNPNDAAEDEDEDGASNLIEYQRGTNLEEPDTDGDGMTDGWEIKYGFLPNDRSDALMDSDGDSYSNLDEFNAGTDPNDNKDKPSASEDDDPLLLVAIIAIIVLIIIIILVAILLIVRSRKKEENEETTEGTSGEDIAPPTSWSEQEQEISSECPSCGASLEEGMDYCPECGEVIQTSDGEGITAGPVEEDSMLEEDEEGITQAAGMEDPYQDNVDPPEGMPGMEDDISMTEPPSM